MDLGLRDKVAVVTGGSSGIGRAIVSALGAEGARVVVVDRDPSPDDGLHLVQGDLTDAETCARAAREAVERFGAIDVLVHAVGIASTADVAELEEEVWDRMLAVNLKSAPCHGC